MPVADRERGADAGPNVVHLLKELERGQMRPDDVDLVAAVETAGYDVNAMNCAAEIVEKTGDVAEVRRLAEQLRGTLQPVALDGMRERISTAAMGVCAAGRDVVVLLGETGCGKTTAVHFLAGSVLGETEDEDLEVVTAANGAQGLRIGDGTQSTTRCMAGVGNAGALLVDTVGFGDTAGDDTASLAQHAALVGLLRSSKSARIAMLVEQSKLTSSNGNGVRRALSLLETISVRAEDVAPAVTYVITKVGDKGHKKALKFAEQLPEQPDMAGSATKPFAIEFAQQVCNGRALWLKPLSDDPQRALAVLQSAGPVRNPSAAFAVSLPQQLRSALLQTLAVEGARTLRLVQRGATGDIAAVEACLALLRDLGGAFGREVEARVDEIHSAVGAQIAERAERLRLQMGAFFSAARLVDPEGDAGEIAAGHARMAAALGLWASCAPQEAVRELDPQARMQTYLADTVDASIAKDPRGAQDMLCRCDALAAKVKPCRKVLHDFYYTLRRRVADSEDRWRVAVRDSNADAVESIVAGWFAVKITLPGGPAADEFARVVDDCVIEITECVHRKEQLCRTNARVEEKYNMELTHGVLFLHGVTQRRILREAGIAPADCVGLLDLIQDKYEQALAQRFEGACPRGGFCGMVIDTALAIDRGVGLGWKTKHDVRMGGHTEELVSLLHRAVRPDADGVMSKIRRALRAARGVGGGGGAPELDEGVAGLLEMEDNIACSGDDVSLPRLVDAAHLLGSVLPNSAAWLEACATELIKDRHRQVAELEARISPDVATDKARVRAEVIQAHPVLQLIQQERGNVPSVAAPADAARDVLAEVEERRAQVHRKWVCCNGHLRKALAVEAHQQEARKERAAAKARVDADRAKHAELQKLMAEKNAQAKGYRQTFLKEHGWESHAALESTMRELLQRIHAQECAQSEDQSENDDEVDVQSVAKLQEEAQHLLENQNALDSDIRMLREDGDPSADPRIAALLGKARLTLADLDAGIDTLSVAKTQRRECEAVAAGLRQIKEHALSGSPAGSAVEATVLGEACKALDQAVTGALERQVERINGYWGELQKAVATQCDSIMEEVQGEHARLSKVQMTARQLRVTLEEFRHAPREVLYTVLEPVEALWARLHSVLQLRDTDVAFLRAYAALEVLVDTSRVDHVLRACGGDCVAAADLPSFAGLKDKHTAEVQGLLHAEDGADPQQVALAVEVTLPLYNSMSSMGWAPARRALKKLQELVAKALKKMTASVVALLNDVGSEGFHGVLKEMQELRDLSENVEVVVGPRGQQEQRAVRRLVQAVSEDMMRYIDSDVKNRLNIFQVKKELNELAPFASVLNDAAGRSLSEMQKANREETGKVLGMLTGVCPMEWGELTWEDFERCLTGSYLDRRLLTDVKGNVRKSLKRAIAEQDGSSDQDRRIKRALRRLAEVESLKPLMEELGLEHTHTLEQVQNAGVQAEERVQEAMRDLNFTKVERAWQRNLQGVRERIAGVMLEELDAVVDAGDAGRTLLVAEAYRRVADEGDEGSPLRKRCDAVLDNLGKDYAADMDASPALSEVGQQLGRLADIVRKGRSGSVWETMREGATLLFTRVAEMYEEIDRRLEQVCHAENKSLGPDAVALHDDARELARHTHQMDEFNARDAAGIACTSLRNALVRAAEAYRKDSDRAGTVSSRAKRLLTQHVKVVERLADLVAVGDSVAREKYFAELEVSAAALATGGRLLASKKNYVLDALQRVVGRGKEAAAAAQPDWERVNTVLACLTELEKFEEQNIAEGAKQGTRELKDGILKRGEGFVADRKVSSALMNLQRLKEVGQYEKWAQEQMNVRLTACASLGAGEFSALVEELDDDETGVGARVVNEQPFFEQERIKRHADITGRVDVGTVLKEMRKANSNLDASSLEKAYDEIKQRMDEHIQRGPTPKNIAKVITSAKTNGDKLKQKVTAWFSWGSAWNPVKALLADILAFWSLSRVKGGVHDAKMHYPRPHFVQVCAILCALGWTGDKPLAKTVVRVPTGEGKSLVLFALAVTSWFLGRRPYVVCYSSHLSARDYADFKPLYQDLAVEAFYGTFNACCEDAIRGRALREEVRELLCDKAVRRSKPDTRPKCLLIDEVDVFFDKTFYGNSYTPSLKMDAPSLKGLTDIMWRSRRTPARLKLAWLQGLPEFTAFKNAFPHLDDLCNEVVMSLAADLVNYETGPRWHVDPVTLETTGTVKLGYVEQDTVDYTKLFDYSTLWATYHEYHLGNAVNVVDKEAKLERALYVLLKLGFFSYADIAKHEFTSVVGVSGTLPPERSCEAKLMREFNITEQWKMPSMYGKCMREFHPLQGSVKVADAGAPHHAALFAEIQKFGGFTDEVKRAVLVFFETQEGLERFHEFAERRLAGMTHASKLRKMMEGITLTERKDYTRRATEPGAVTLATRVYGRGVDFIVWNKVCLAAGGLHVIQTFMGPMSEHEQIMGRAGRQGQPGSFSMVLDAGQLEKLLIQRDEAMAAQDGSTLYALLREKAMSYYKTELEMQSKEIGQVQADHKESMKFRQSVQTQTPKALVSRLLEWNRAPRPCAGSRTVVLLDATGSMGHLIHGAKTCLREVFGRMGEILRDAGKASASYSIQMCCYRSYNAPDMLQASRWSDTPQALCDFLEPIRAAWGWGREAVELGLHHVMQEHEKNAETPVTQVILLGDAPATDDADFDNYARRGYSPPLQYGGRWTTWKEQARRLRAAEIPVCAFYLHGWAADNFKAIADVTNGRCAPLDVNSSEGVTQLTDALSESILRDIGGDDLMQMYRAKYCSSYA